MFTCCTSPRRAARRRFRLPTRDADWRDFGLDFSNEKTYRIPARDPKQCVCEVYKQKVLRSRRIGSREVMVVMKESESE